MEKCITYVITIFLLILQIYNQSVKTKDTGYILQKKKLSMETFVQNVIQLQ